MANASRRKTSFEVDFAKVDAVRALLGTSTLTDTVDAALAEVIDVAARRALLNVLFTAGALQLDDADVMSAAWR